MTFRGGIKEAAKLLTGLDPEGRVRVLELIAQKNPEIAELLKKNIVQMSDLSLMTPKMLTEFMGWIDTSVLALALKIESDDLIKFFTDQVSSGIKRDILDVLNGPKVEKSKVLEAQDKILTLVREKIDQGKLVLKKDNEQYV
ncbi:FliG C-terminal domain-containing protein [Bacteriovoracaceae bacterium]|nr:FliG C-terminal domain-containing protein [Bacteriovoracaceae bacterium]